MDQQQEPSDGEPLPAGSDDNDHIDNDDFDNIINNIVFDNGPYKFHDDEHTEFVHYAIDNDGRNDNHCSDDDCSREHVYVFTRDELAARDNANYDAGYRSAT